MPKPIASLSMKDLDQRLRETPFQNFALAAKQNGYSSPGKLLLDATVANLAAPGSAVKGTPGYFRRPGVKRSSLDLANALEELFVRADSGDLEVVGLFKLLGRHAAAHSKPRKSEKPALGPAPQVEGEFWDLASGVYLEHQFPFMEKDRTYRFFDTSPLAASFLLGLSERWGIHGEVEQKDVRTLEPPRAGTIAAIRSSNASAYAPGLSNRLSQMSLWIKPGGYLILQSNSPLAPLSNLEHMLTNHKDLIENRLRDGWKLQANFNGAYVFDTVVLVRPLQYPDQLPSEEEVRRIWAGLLLSVQMRVEYAD